MSEVDKIHWLASYPKSGNTWLRALLYAYKFRTPFTIEQIKGHVMGDQLPQAWFAVSPVPWGYLNNDERLMLRYPALMQTAFMSLHRPVIVKTHCANVRVNSVELIPEELTGRSVYLVRDPRDVAISYSHHMGIDIDKAIEQMGSDGCALDQGEEQGGRLGIMQIPGSWSLNVKSWVDDGKFERVIARYEDLLSDPVSQFVGIYRAIYDEEPDIEVVKQAVELCRFDRLKESESADGFSEATKHGVFFRSGKSGQWQDILTPEQVTRIEEDHGEWMQNMGYALSQVKAA